MGTEFQISAPCALKYNHEDGSGNEGKAKTQAHDETEPGEAENNSAGRHSFTVDFSHPLSPVQAFATSISSLQSKILSA